VQGGSTGGRDESGDRERGKGGKRERNFKHPSTASYLSVRKQVAPYGGNGAGGDGGDSSGNEGMRWWRR
jgi:hypothetical protein